MAAFSRHGSSELSKPVTGASSLIVVDGECDRAVVFTAAPARHTGGVLVLLYVTDDADFRGFLGVERVMRAEARAEAERVPSPP